MEQQEHWDNIYRHKASDEMSWTQDIPQVSLDFIRSFSVAKDAPIIDIGGGESKLADFLLEEGYTDITVLDISAPALERARQRLGDKAGLVKWIVSDITTFTPERSYTVWHDRATFHFLTTPEQITAYLSIAGKAATGYLAIGTFSDKGPDKCSGLVIKKYSEDELTQQLVSSFEKINCITENHTTPFHTTQNFLFCSFRARNAG
ncbi:class I SAM-dependent methyltransferase [Chitinophaga solisilvae]|uniref:class I SAM-dependent methyltransferase n=1 Tax=Chitinophaga solisilvae TaxID=1233460 RepID=UPI00136D89DD|nr:class I SAM-dependent methyltransferase [Chitinophaga solisilvae]